MMQKIFKYQKPISLIVMVSLFCLYMPQLPAQGAMITTEDAINQDPRPDYDRARVKAFVSRHDVVAQLQSYGISFEEALARVDNLTDREIDLIVGKLDQLPAGSGAESLGWAGVLFVEPVVYFTIAAVIIAIFCALYFGR
jgi:hypothetical protein